jgi:predicted ABC-type transport system involved in lysophospholipase L1 biosynthesis ATPase subunit
VVGILPGVLLLAAFTMVGPVIQSVVPYRLRGMGSALASVYVFFVGATGGALLAAFFTNAYGPRAAVLIVGIPSTLVGGFLIMRSASSIKYDLSLVVAELRQELAEQQRQSRDPEHIPAIHVDSVDFSYGHVQVLFDVGFEVRRGEVLALLGTKGAGKSTILRVIAGLGTPSRGVVRLHGTTITYVAPEQRVKYGIRLLPGGKGVFPQMTVRENLEMGAYIYRDNHAERERRIARVLDLFDVFADRQHQMAASLSGPAATARAGHHTVARPRRVAHRRALVGLVTDRRRTAARRRGTPEARRHDDRARRTVAERGAVDRRSRRVPREGTRPLRRLRPRPRGTE